MPDQIYAAGPLAAPETYEVPGSQQMVPRACRAVVDGTNASGPFVPTLIFTSQAGHVIGAVATSTTVAAGSSADVTWAPFLRGAQAAVAGSGVPYAIASGRNATLADSAGYTTISLTSGTFITSDATLYSLAASGGFNGIKIAAAGSYLVGVGCEGFPNAGVAAGAAVGVTQLGAGSVRFIIPTEVIPWTQRADGALYQGNAAQVYLIEVGKPANPVGLILRVQAEQNTGDTADMTVYLFVAKLTTAIP